MSTTPWRDLFRCDRAALVLAAATALFHLATARGYGIFRDELYYLACGEHLAFGYVDHPPLGALVMKVVRSLLGTSLHAIRLLPALCAGALVALTAALAQRLGGGRAAQLLAGLAVAVAPVYLSLFSTYSINALDLVIWALLCRLVLEILASEAEDARAGRLWLAFGVLAGIGLQNKVSVLFLGFGVAVGLVLERSWRDLRRPQLWLGLLVALVIFAPHVLWQIAHGWPTLEFIQRATATKNLPLAPGAFLRSQAGMMGVFALPLWLLGLVSLFRSQRRFRLFGWAYLGILLVMISNNAKPYYLAPIYPVLIAAGATHLERWTAPRRWLRPVAALVLLLGLYRAPLAKPLLPVDTLVAYSAAIGVAPSTDERARVGRLSQYFADMHGWQALAEAVAAVHRALPPADRAAACVFGQNYGHAGAIDLYGPALGLPPGISGHNSYWLWGPGACTGEVLIAIGGRQENHERAFAEVTAAGRFLCADCRPFESDLTLWVLRQPRRTMAERWPRVKHYD